MDHICASARARRRPVELFLCFAFYIKLSSATRSVGKYLSYVSRFCAFKRHALFIFHFHIFTIMTSRACVIQNRYFPAPSRIRYSSCWCTARFLYALYVNILRNRTPRFHPSHLCVGKNYFSHVLHKYMPLEIMHFRLKCFKCIRSFDVNDNC